MGREIVYERSPEKVQADLAMANPNLGPVISGPASCATVGANASKATTGQSWQPWTS